MHEILRNLRPGARVLDLGCRHGSFPAGLCQSALIVRLDLDRPEAFSSNQDFVQADAAWLPFANHSFNAIIANHSLEHVLALKRVAAEMVRVLHPDGAMYVAVPDSSTFSDRLYRWVYHGGGHINAFRSADAVNASIAMHGAGMRLLHSSFGFLHRSHFQSRPPRRMWLFFNGRHEVIALLGYICRLMDRVLGTRLSIYGWALFYGRIAEPVETGAWANVCIKCGSAQPARSLRPNVLRIYFCPACGARNLFTKDFL